MAFDIYTNGNFEQIVAAYNGLAMVYDNSSGLYYAAGIVSLLALFGWSINKIYDPRAASPTHQFFIGWLIFLVLAGPESKSSVQITSNQTGQTQFVDNVPFVVALGGSLSTSLLTTVTEKLKQAFSVVYPTGTPYEVIGTMEPLQALVKLNQLDYLNTSVCSFKNEQFCENLMSYYLYCTDRDQTTGGAKQETSVGNILNAPPADIFDTMKISYEGWSAPYLTTGSSVASTKSCGTYGTLLKARLSSGEFSSLMSEVNKQKGVSEESAAQGSAMLTNAAVSDGFEISKARFLGQIIAQANAKHAALTGGDILVSQTEFQAKEQRNAKAAGTAQIFNDMAPALITFIEFFALFAAPITLSLLVAGRYGIVAITNYLLLMVMMNLWPLCGVGIESFIQFSLLSAADGSFDSTSFSINSIGSTIDRVQTYLAVGSTMMAAIPTLSMYLITRSVGSMSGLMSSAATSAPVNAHYVAPNLSTAPDAGVSRSGADSATSDDMSKSGPVSGRKGLGMDISHGGAVGGTAQSTLSNIHNKQHQIAAQIVDQYGSGHSTQSSGGVDGSAGTSVVGSNGKGVGFRNADSSDVGNAAQTSEREARIEAVQNALRTSVGADGKLDLAKLAAAAPFLNLGGGKNGSPVSAAVGGGVQNTETTSLTDQSGLANDRSTKDANGNTISNDYNSNAKLGTNGNRTNGEKYSDTGSETKNAQNLASYAKSFAELEYESKVISNTAQSSMQVQNASSTNTATLASRFGALSQEDFVKGLSQETQEKLQKSGVIDSTGAFAGEYAKMWQEKRELNDKNPGWNNTQRNNDATIETLVTAANKAAEKGGSDNYATAADIYGTLNNGAHDGSYEGAHDKTLQLIQNDFQNLSGMVGKDALDQQAMNAGERPFDTEQNKQNIEKVQGAVAYGQAATTQEATELRQQGETAKTDQAPESAYGAGQRQVQSDQQVATHYQQTGEKPKTEAEQKRLDAVYPVNSPKQNVPDAYKQASGDQEKKTEELMDAEVKSGKVPVSKKAPENIVVPPEVSAKGQEATEKFLAEKRNEIKTKHNQDVKELPTMKTASGQEIPRSTGRFDAKVDNAQPVTAQQGQPWQTMTPNSFTLQMNPDKTTNSAPPAAPIGVDGGSKYSLWNSAYNAVQGLTSSPTAPQALNGQNGQGANGQNGQGGTDTRNTTAQTVPTSSPTAPQALNGQNGQGGTDTRNTTAQTVPTSSPTAPQALNNQSTMTASTQPELFKAPNWTGSNSTTINNNTNTTNTTQVTQAPSAIAQQPTGASSGNEKNGKGKVKEQEQSQQTLTAKNETGSSGLAKPLTNGKDTGVS